MTEYKPGSSQMHDDHLFVIFSEQQRILYRGDNQLSLNEYASQCLVLLMQHEGKIVSKEQIHDACWGSKGVMVTDASVRQVITQLRKSMNLLDIPAEALETQSRRGYCLHKGYIKNEKNLVSPSIGTPNPVQTASATATYAAKAPRFSFRQPGNRLLTILFACSVLLSILAYNVSPFYTFHPVEYKQIKNEDGRYYFSQNGFTPDNNLYQTLYRIEKKGSFNSEVYRYVYFNRTYSKDYMAVILCKTQMGKEDSHCLSVQLLGG
jgi:DNA-binding winged helix-turn-helix (wHTH) protein